MYIYIRGFVHIFGIQDIEHSKYFECMLTKKDRFKVNPCSKYETISIVYIYKYIYINLKTKFSSAMKI